MIEILQGDALERLRDLPDESVQCCVTSPPYWGLRDYGDVNQIGLEKSPGEYVARLVAVFEGVRRALRKDGTLWLNLGDSYAQDSKWGGMSGGKNYTSAAGGISRQRKFTGLKNKDLVGIPWLVAFALRDAGWYLRSDIIWSKPNPMPESVQGSHYSRHRVTVEEYERLSGLRYIDERAGDAWAGDMPDLSEREIFSSKAPLSGKQKGEGHGKGKRGKGGRSGKTPPIQSVTIRQEEQSQIRIHSEWQNYKDEGPHKISEQPTRETGCITTPPADKTQQRETNPKADGEQQLQTHVERKSVVVAATGQTQGSDCANTKSADGRGVGADGHGAPRSLLLLQTKNEVDRGSCDTAHQGGPAHEGECGSSLRAVQFEEGEQADSPLLVGCPGCVKCLRHHGYLFHLSAGRPTRSHEFLFLLSKSPSYYYDHKAIKDPPSPDLIKQIEEGYNGTALKDYLGASVQDASATKGRIINGYRKRIDKQRGHGRRHNGFNDKWDALTPAEQAVCGRNKRDVWTVPPANYPDAHFATFPTDLIKPCILAGSKAGDTVLDPFFGSGTTGEVALSLGRKCIGIELNPAYIELAKRRCDVTMGLPL